MNLNRLQPFAVLLTVSLLSLPALAGSAIATQPARIAGAADHRAIVPDNSRKFTTAPAATDTVAAQASASIRPDIPGPTITTQPANQSCLVGTNAYFNVVATDTAPLLYQWLQGGVPIGTGTAATLRLNAVQLSSSGSQFSVIVSDTTGAAVTSSTATLSVVAPAALVSPTLPTIGQTTFLVTSYGAVGDGATDNTSSIQNALNAAAKTGGIVEFPAASQSYLSGPVTIGSSTDLQIDSGAILQMLPYYSGTDSPTPAGYYPLTGSSYQNFVSCSSAHDVEITGPGRIDGQGAPWWTAYTADKTLPGRPYLIDFSNGNRVLVTGVTFSNSPSFHLRIGGNNLTAFDVTVMDTNPNNNALNTDGIDPSGTNILVQSCTIGVFDDDVCVKPQDAFCSNITIANCSFGTGHGVSVGGQTNDGLNGMTVTNCTFNGTTNGLRMKADPTEGGVVQNVSYSGITMTNVTYPIVFYSYYNVTGTPDGTSTGTAQKDNQTPPDSLNTTTLPVWENISISNFTATGATGDSILWGLPLANCFINNVLFNNVKISGGGSFQIYDSANVQFTGSSSVGTFITNNSLAITTQPQSKTVDSGSNVTLTASTVGTSGANTTAPTYQWGSNGAPLTNGTNADGSIVSGAQTNTLQIADVQTGEAGSYTITASNSLDTYNVTAGAYAPNSAPVTATSAAATLTVLTPFQVWAASYGLNPAGNGAEDANPTGDGLPNLLVYVLGGNPTQTNVALLPTATLTTVSNNPALVYQVNLNKAAAAANPVTVQYSSDLVNWTTAVNGQNGVTIGTTSLNSSTEQTTATFSNVNPAFFARLIVAP